MTAMLRTALLVLIPFLLAGCDVIKDRMGVKDPAAVEAEAKAIGASCRLSGRGLEDCYNLNERQPRAPIYAGWKEMNEYMAQRNMEVQRPTLGDDGKPIEPVQSTESKEAAKEAAKEPAKEPAKDIKPKLPDLAKEAAAAKR